MDAEANANENENENEDNNNNADDDGGGDGEDERSNLEKGKRALGLVLGTVFGSLVLVLGTRRWAARAAGRPSPQERRAV